VIACAACCAALRCASLLRAATEMCSCSAPCTHPPHTTVPQLVIDLFDEANSTEVAPGDAALQGLHQRALAVMDALADAGGWAGGGGAAPIMLWLAQSTLQLWRHARCKGGAAHAVSGPHLDGGHNRAQWCCMRACVALPRPPHLPVPHASQTLIPTHASITSPSLLVLSRMLPPSTPTNCLSAFPCSILQATAPPRSPTALTGGRLACHRRRASGRCCRPSTHQTMQASQPAWSCTRAAGAAGRWGWMACHRLICLSSCSTFFPVALNCWLPPSCLAGRRWLWLAIGRAHV